jgi:hypothetical protein
MAAKVTPPGSLLDAPLTPPPTAKKSLSRSAQRVLSRFKSHRAGHKSQVWWQQRLDLRDYMKVLNTLAGDSLLRDYVEDKVR